LRLILRIIFSAYVLFITFIPSLVQGGTCTLVSTVQIVPSEEKIDLSIQIHNSGNETASSVVIEVFIDHTQFKTNYIGDVEPGQSRSNTISISKDKVSSSRVLFSILRYSVSSGIEYSYPLNVYALHSDSDPYLDLTTFPVKLIDIGELKLLLSNDTDFKKELKITPLLPYEIKSEPISQQIALLPKGQKLVSFKLLNRWAPINSQYPGFFIVEGPGGRVVGSASFSISIGSHKEKGLGVIGVLISVLTIVGLMEISKVLDQYNWR